MLSLTEPQRNNGESIDLEIRKPLDLNGTKPAGMNHNNYAPSRLPSSKKPVGEVDAPPVSLPHEPVAVLLQKLPALPTADKAGSIHLEASVEELHAVPARP